MDFADVFAVTKTVIHKDTGKTIGMVVLYIEEAVIASIYDKEMNYKGGRFFIPDRNGQIISSHNKASLFRDYYEATAISGLDLNGEEASFIHDGGTQRNKPSHHSNRCTVFVAGAGRLFPVVPFDHKADFPARQNDEGYSYRTYECQKLV
ncbi:cache domain-containing protein [Cohnella panacarvi]|uniref:cache domain-containing protein n=1 Tax=Cohnella panacarvi TaxID=400776 RepID=UPI00047E6833|nr:cache domain-containing protein [Cohnella panacarvi]